MLGQSWGEKENLSYTNRQGIWKLPGTPKLHTQLNLDSLYCAELSTHCHTSGDLDSARSTFILHLVHPRTKMGHILESEEGS